MRGRIWKYSCLAILLSCLFGTAIESKNYADSHDKTIVTEETILKSIMFLKGASDESELSEEIIEEFLSLAAHPIEINLTNTNHLRAIGLFSPYQCAVIEDYRRCSGDILSLTELSLLDGFGLESAAALSPFIRFHPSSSIGTSLMYKQLPTGKISIRNGNSYVINAGYSGHGGIKASVSLVDRFDINASISSHFDCPFPEIHSFSGTVYGRKFLGKLIIGDFNVRFGQGLALWSGFSMAGINSVESFTRSARGVVAYTGWSGHGSKRGVAAEVVINSWRICPFVAIGGLREMMAPKPRTRNEIEIVPLSGFNVLRLFRAGQVSLTCLADYSPFLKKVLNAKVAGDVRWNIRGTELFSECAFDIVNSSPAILFGVVKRLEDGWCLAGMIRYYHPKYNGDMSGAVRSGTRCTNEHGISLAASHRLGRFVRLKGREGFGSSEKRLGGNLSLDVAYFPEHSSKSKKYPLQIRFKADENIRLSPSVSLSVKVSEQIRVYETQGRELTKFKVGNIVIDGDIKRKGHDIRHKIENIISEEVRYKTGYGIAGKIENINKEKGRYDVRHRSELRIDTEWSDNRWIARGRCALSHGKAVGIMGYVECGHLTKNWRTYLRLSCFRVDNWEDRIYSYERDTPGGFSVPAFYGRGYRLTYYATWRLSQAIRFYLRASWADYPFKRHDEAKRKPGKAELKILLTVDIGRLLRHRSRKSV